ncbi:hypothetical protein HDU77_011569 [Chytriomyces hyalinus]|nr:hypothetical protein HDU77_011569 [Chytriomyces hyalinus]
MEEQEEEQEEEEEDVGRLRGPRLDRDIREEEHQEEDWVVEDREEEDIFQQKDMFKLLISDMKLLKSNMTKLLEEVALVRRLN